MTKRASIDRRRFLQSTLWAGGAGLSLDQVLRQQASAEVRRTGRSDTAVIQVWLGGGPSQFETFDPKPDAPAEIRGPYGAIATRLPGVLFCEKLPRLAQTIERAAILRTVTHGTNDHFGGAHWCSTGYLSNTGRTTHPASGAIASKLRGAGDTGVPAYVLMSEEQTRNPEIATVMGSAYLGSQHAPFSIKHSPYISAYQPERVREAVASLKLADDFTLARVDDRKSLLDQLDRFSRQADAKREMNSMDSFHHLALDMLTSGAARRAFDLNEEPASIRNLYGHHRWGQMGLLARRLVEAGVTFVTINTAPDSLCWDWHRNIVDDNRPADGSDGPTRGMNISGPPLDQMLSGLITDLYERGLDRKVLLLVWGEFGRTPRVNATGGRDHWGSLMSVLMAGGGLRVGQVIGTSSAKGEVPTNRAIAPTDVLATVYRHLGIELTAHTMTTAGRPIPLLPHGKPIAELI